eukprot:tig00000430_g591.t1
MALKHFSSLSILRIDVLGDLDDSAPYAHQSIACVSLVPSLRVLDLRLPLPVSVLSALSPLKSSLRDLSFEVEIASDIDGAGLGPAIAAASVFTGLQRLHLEFSDCRPRPRNSSVPFKPSASEAELRALCALGKMRGGLRRLAAVQSLGFENTQARSGAG